MLMMPDSNSIIYILVNTEIMVIKTKVLIIDLLILSGPFWAFHGIQRNAILSLQLQCLRILLRLGCDHNDACDGAGLNALQLAQRSGSTGCVQELLAVRAERDEVEETASITAETTHLLV